MGVSPGVIYIELGANGITVIHVVENRECTVLLLF